VVFVGHCWRVYHLVGIGGIVTGNVDGKRSIVAVGARVPIFLEVS